MALPFLKWPGGKRWAIEAIAPIVRKHLTGTYYEPFLGGGALFFHIHPRRSVLSDINGDLINTYRMVKTEAARLEKMLRSMRVSKRAFYALRASEPVDPLSRAARFLYLNRTAFGGMYRLNALGRFNVPYGGGQRTPAPLWERGLLQDASVTLAHATLKTRDFAKTMAQAGAGDVVYCDPTYTVAHDRNGFIRYNEHNFSWEDQKRLAKAAMATAARGATVIVSNAHHSSIRALYPTARSRVLTRQSLISTNAKNRGAVKEYLFILQGPSTEKEG